MEVFPGCRGIENAVCPELEIKSGVPAIQRVFSGFSLFMKNVLRSILCAACLFAGISETLAASPMGSVITYQGRLNDGGYPANGLYDLQFALYDAPANGAQLGLTLTNAETFITNGFFTVSLDFGPVFNSSAVWLEVAARSNGNDVFWPVLPRQAITPTPQALYAVSAGVASSVAATDITGTLPSGAYTETDPVFNASAAAGIQSSDVLNWNTKIGLTGPQGPQGETGPTGPMGPQGPEGPTGPTGAIGTTGPQGPQGEPGPIGAMGPQGPEGPSGATGATGPQGPEGQAGAAGVSGGDGKTILNGTVAPEVSQGVDGDFYLNIATSQLFGPKAAGAWPAAVSLVGPTGAAGATGATGPQGPQGEPGPIGAMGPQGPEGPSGATGATGPQGPEGQAGAAGVSGGDGKTIINGTVAPEASQGMDGDFYLNTATSQLFGPKAAGAWPVAVSLVGPTGPVGATGTTGPQGPQGELGPTGPMGPQGPEGQTGAIGATGPQGPQGEFGPTGPMGPQGPEGPTGAIGATGPQGPQGELGPTGAMGPQGPEGPTGAIGATGPQGPQGEPGPTGAMGPQGPEGQTGAIGATGPQGAQGEIGPIGAMGPQGSQGLQGEAGPAGASPFSLNGADAVYTAGSVGVGVTSPNSSAALDVDSTAKGFLAPRMTSVQRNAVASPATGLLVYQTTSPSGFYFYNGSSWTGPLGTSGVSTSPYFSISSAVASGNSNGNGTYYLSHGGGLLVTEKDALRILPFNYTKATITVAMSGSVSSPYTVTLRKNYSSTVAQCVVNSSSQVTSTATTSFAAGDLVAIQVSGTAAINAAGQQQSLMISVVFE